jgi:hypothetical protein
MPRKRTRDEMEASEPPAQVSQDTPLIHKIRNMWEFASVMQYIHTFGKAVKLDNDFDIQVRDPFTASLSHPDDFSPTLGSKDTTNETSVGL